jgi:hypothetical protein
MGVFWPAGFSGERSPDTVPIAFSTEFLRLTCGSNHGQPAQLGSGSQKPTFSIVSRSVGIVTAGDGWKVATLVLGLRRSQKDRLDEICRVLMAGYRCWARTSSMCSSGSGIRWNQRDDLSGSPRQVQGLEAKRILGRGRKEGTRGQTKQNKTTVRGIPMWSPTIVLTSRYTA